MVTYIYWRKATESEIRFGYGSAHYQTFQASECCRKDGKPKKWFKHEGTRFNLWCNEKNYSI